MSYNVGLDLRIKIDNTSSETERHVVKYIVDCCYQNEGCNVDSFFCFDIDCRYTEIHLSCVMPKQDATEMLIHIHPYIREGAFTETVIIPEDTYAVLYSHNGEIEAVLNKTGLFFGKDLIQVLK
jgi:hypothetical protein